MKTIALWRENFKSQFITLARTKIYKHKQQPKDSTKDCKMVEDMIDPIVDKAVLARRPLTDIYNFLYKNIWVKYQGI